ncbi:MAG: nucleotidyltransferase family protein [Paracoccaceae bacterium]|nr:nucleotidyltransferase family protein [Paracoccaceae bacterium]
MNGPDTAMILAAGFGTRMQPLTNICPKPLLPVAGRPMIDLVLDHAEAAGVRRAVINLHYLGGMIRDRLAGREVPELLFSEEEPEILDTGGGIVRALPLLGARPFYALNSDAVWAGPNPLEVLAGAWDAPAMDALLLVVPCARAKNYSRHGDFFLEGARPVRRGAEASAPYVYSGAQIVAPEVFSDARSGPFSMNVIWDALLAHDRVAAVVYPGAWVDVGTPEGLAVASAALEEAAR